MIECSFVKDVVEVIVKEQLKFVSGSSNVNPRTAQKQES